MIELGDGDMGECGEAGLAPGNRLYGCRGLHDLLAGSAAIFRTDSADDAPLHRRDIEHLVAVLPERTQGASAGRTGADACFRLNPAFGTRQMRRQGADRRRSLPLIRLDLADIGKLSFAFQLLKGEFELFDLEGQLLRRLAKGEPSELGQLETQGIDQRVAGRQSCLQLGDAGVLIDGGRASIRHLEIVSKRHH